MIARSHFSQQQSSLRMFDTAHYPMWTFTSTSIAPTSTGFTVRGTLTVHGVAQATTLTVTKQGSRYHATGTLDRHGFAMRRTPMDGMIGPDITLDLDIALQ